MQTNPDQIGALGAFQELVERELLSVVFENAPTQVFVVDATTMRFVAANAAARASISTSWPQLKTMQPSDLFMGAVPGRIEKLLDKVRRRKSRQAKMNVWSNIEAGLRFEFAATYSDTAKPSFVLFLGDVSKSYRAAIAANDKLQEAIESLPDGFVLYDAYDRLVVCNERYRELYRQSAPAMVPGARFEDILRHGLKHGQYAEAKGCEEDWLKERLMAHHKADSVVEQQLADGRWLRILEQRTKDGGRVGLRVDITAIKQQQQELNRLALTDDLTGLLNRRGLTERMRELTKGLRRGQRLVLMQVDLDRFKIINDLRGHDAGDYVLQHAAQVMEHGPLRPAAVARVGGDEFVLVLRTRRNDTALVDLAHRLISYISDPVFFNGQRISTTASIGIAYYRHALPDPMADIVSAADLALNQVKSNGGNDAALFHDSMRAEAQHNNQMADQMLLGLSRREFLPFFQPQIDTQTGDVIGFESLIRWQHPVRGLVPAFQFLEIAQRSGLTEALDDIVMDRSCHAARQLLDWGMKDPQISINMSIAQISDPTIVTRLECHMQTHGIGSNHIRIELLESTLLDKRSSQIVRNVHNLIAAGFLVELDDFGTGHAAIATLRQFAVSCIKIDRSLVQNIDTDAELQVITSAIINLAKRLGIAVLAEGVETRPEQVTLQQMGCHKAQGYLHAKPMPLDQLRSFLKDRDLVN